MSYEHNYLKNLFLSESYANALYQFVIERDSFEEPKFSDKILRRLWKKKEPETDHDINDICTTIEYGDWDIGIEAEGQVCMYTSESKEFCEKYGDFHTEEGVTFCSEDDPTEVVITRNIGPGDITVCVDVCPNLGEEYPHILRDMERKIPDDDDLSYKYVLLIDECSVESCEWAELVDIFDQHDITLCSFKELMQ